MNILVTGITGRIGANIARHFLQKGHKVRGLVWPGDRQAENLEKTLRQAQGGRNLEIVEGDLRTLTDVKDAADGQEVILHLGAAFQAGRPFTPEQYFDTNIKGVFNVCEAALGLGAGLKHLVFTSTDATLSKYPPGGMTFPLTESNVPQGSTDWYGFSKIEGEHLVNRYVRHDALKATVIRFPMVWGAGEVLDYPQFRLSHWLNTFKNRTDPVGEATFRSLKALDDGPSSGPFDRLRTASGQRRERLVIACDEKGRPWRKHCIEARDIVHAYDKAVANPNTYGKTYQIAGPAPFTWDEVVPMLGKHLDMPYSRVTLAGVPPTFYEFDISAARRDFGFDPKVTMKDMIEEAARFRREGGGELVPTQVGR